jgi:hypothetical protein
MTRRMKLSVLCAATVFFGELLLAVVSDGGPTPRAAPDAQQLSYYSDYFSFVGEDDRRKVAFALDNNRGQDGDAFQAEHFVVMHDARKGWIDVSGNGLYPNPEGMLTAIPDSAFFRFSGMAEQGISITSEANALRLDVSVIPRILVRQRGPAIFWLGSAAATLHWDGRAIRGRVIYEYLHRPGYNRMTRKQIGQWNNFHGLYLAIEGGGDLYIHSRGPTDEDLTGRLIGFAAIDEVAHVMEAIELEALQSTQAFGFYRWPDAWTGRFTLQGARYELKVDTIQRKTISNWLIGGFAMSIVQGELLSGGVRRAVYGFGELII